MNEEGQHGYGLLAGPLHFETRDAHALVSAFLIARALQPIEQLIGSWKSLATARTCYNTIDELLSGDRHLFAPTALPAPRGKVAAEAVTINAGALCGRSEW